MGNDQNFLLAKKSGYLIAYFKLLSSKNFNQVILKPRNYISIMNDNLN